MNTPNTDQRAFWSEQAGPLWVAQMAAMDVTLTAVLDGVLIRAALAPGERVIDVGCGAGTSTLWAATAVGSDGQSVGVDISDSLLASANDRAASLPNVSFVSADAQTHTFDHAGTDCVISRFGVMFFDDPQAAFTNIATALRPEGRMVFATWGLIPENPFFTLPAGVVKQVFGPTPKVDPDAPGPFSMRDTEVTCEMLRAAGLTGIAAEVVPLMLTPEGDVATVAALMCEIGPAQAGLAHFEADADGRARLVAAVAQALAPYETPDGICIPALINFYTARKPA